MGFAQIVFILIIGIIGVIIFLHFKEQSSTNVKSPKVFDLSDALRDPNTFDRFKKNLDDARLREGKNVRKSIGPGEASGKIGQTLFPNANANRKTLIGTNARVLGTRSIGSPSSIASSEKISNNAGGESASALKAKAKNSPTRQPILSPEMLRVGTDELPTMPININTLSPSPSPTFNHVVEDSPNSIEYAQVMIQKMLAPLIVQQGDFKHEVTITVHNLEKFAIDISKVTLKFYEGSRDVSNDYTIINKTNIVLKIPADTVQNHCLYVQVSETATLGKITVIPIVLIQSNQGKEISAQMDTSRLFQWKVEPIGRIFNITTEHKGVETAGIPFSVKLEAFYKDTIDQNYFGPHRVYFTLNKISNPNSFQIPSYLDLTFDQGVAQTPNQFSFFNTMETYTLSAKDDRAGGPDGSSNNIVLEPGELGTFRIEISSPQRNNVNLEGTNTLTALDVYGNIKTDYRNDTLLNSDQGSVKGLVNNLISGTEFKQGLVNLTDLKVRISIPDFSQEGKIIRVKARSGTKFGVSNEITILPSTALSQQEISVSATEFTIRRLCGYRRKHIWVVNTDSTTAQGFESNFQKDYDLIFRNITHQDLDSIAANHPDILFLDVENAREDGYQLMRDIRQLPNMESLPIFIIGASTESESQISNVIRCGCIYVTKPIVFSAVKATLNDLLQNISIEQGQMPIRGARIQGSEGFTYQIISKVGEGGMGYIYEAKRLRDQKRVIIKYLPPRDVKNIKSVMRFIQEAHTVLSFNHENLVMGYDMLMDRNRCFYVMEFIEGKTLEKLIQQERRIAPDKSVRIILQVARAISCLEEECNLVHRDIKPSNILVTDQGLVKLVDFGIAKISTHHLTTAGIILGTPYYLSPEQITGQEVTIQSDIYSLGATFYHMVTGTHPFQGSDVYSIVHQRLNRDPVDPRHYSPALPKAVAQIIMRMMNQKPSNRYSPVKTLIEELERVLEGMESGEIPFV